MQWYYAVGLQPKKLEAITDEINNIPRKGLGELFPYVVCVELQSSSARNTHSSINVMKIAIQI